MEPLSGLADLLALQKVDTAIDKLLQERQSLPEIAKHSRARRAAQEAARTSEDSHRRLRSLDRDIARTEDELQLAEQRLREQESRLFAGGMSARETDNLRSEVENLRRRISSMEDELIELLDQQGDMQEEARELAEQAKSTGEAESRLAGRIAESWAGIDKSVEGHRTRRGEIVRMVKPRLLAFYERLRERRGGVVVGEISGRVCGACYLEMSIGEYEEVIEDNIPQCIHCAAILVR